jgi:hypothetical protein
MTAVRPVRILVKPFMEARALPSSVQGPVESLALARLATSCFSEIGIWFSFLFILPGAILAWVCGGVW